MWGWWCFEAWVLVFGVFFDLGSGRVGIGFLSLHTWILSDHLHTLRMSATEAALL